jgi:dCTP deaminase
MIEPGQFGLLYTMEKVHVPDNTIAFISIKASIKLRGLVNISGFHVDPGYHGCLKFSVYNAGTETVPLEICKPTFLIWFADLDEPTEDPYDESHRHLNQNGITPDDRVRMRKHVPSPTALDERITILEDRWRIFLGATKYFILPVIVGVIAGAVLWLLTTILPAGTVQNFIGRLTGHRTASSQVAPVTSGAAQQSPHETPAIMSGGPPTGSATVTPSAAPRR